MSDSLFRGAFSNPLVARQFLSAWLPKVFVDLVDWSSLEVRKIAGINEALAERREDVVYRLKAADLRGEEVRRIVEETIPPEEKEQFMCRRSPGRACRRPGRGTAGRSPFCAA
jgi:hypothetical protein